VPKMNENGENGWMAKTPT